MNNFLEKVKNVFKHDQAFEQEQTINSLMNLIFKEQNTSASIKLFENLKKRFEQEIANRGLESLIEHTTCQEYFDRTQTVNHLYN